MKRAVLSVALALLFLSTQFVTKIYADDSIAAHLVSRSTARSWHYMIAGNGMPLILLHGAMRKSFADVEAHHPAASHTLHCDCARPAWHRGLRHSRQRPRHEERRYPHFTIWPNRSAYRKLKSLGTTSALWSLTPMPHSSQRK